MKRISLILVLALLASVAGGCRFAIVENDAIHVRLGAAHAEGMEQFQIEYQELPDFVEEMPESLEPATLSTASPGI